VLQKSKAHTSKENQQRRRAAIRAKSRRKIAAMLAGILFTPKALDRHFGK